MVLNSMNETDWISYYIPLYSEVEWNLHLDKMLKVDVAKILTEILCHCLYTLYIYICIWFPVPAYRCIMYNV